MFFVLVCLIAVALLATAHTPDTAGWMMLVGAAWVAGYLDCRWFARSDRDRARVMPPDAHEPSHDSAMFEP